MKDKHMSKIMNRSLWTTQIVLAALFLFSGIMKFITPVEIMTKDAPFLSAAFMYFIGSVEILGAIGLILPMALHIKPILTPLAASGLTIIMIGAVIITTITMNIMTAIMPLIVGILCAFVAYRRFKH